MSITDSNVVVLNKHNWLLFTDVLTGDYIFLYKAAPGSKWRWYDVCNPSVGGTTNAWSDVRAVYGKTHMWVKIVNKEPVSDFINGLTINPCIADDSEIRELLFTIKMLLI